MRKYLLNIVCELIFSFLYQIRKCFCHPVYILIYSIGGHKAITDYVTPLLDWAVDMLCTAVSTRPLKLPDSMRAPFMRVISWPPWLFNLDSIDKANEFTQKMSEEDKINCPITFFNGAAWIRISANIYNTKDDYIKLREAILKYKS